MARGRFDAGRFDAGRFNRGRFSGRSAGVASPEPVAAPVAAGALADLVLTRDAAMTPVDLSADFTGQEMTFALAPSSAALPAGLALASGGVLSGTPTALASGLSIVARATNTGGTADSAFSLTVEAAIVAEDATAPAAITSGMWTAATGAGGSEIDIDILTLPDDGGSALTALQYSVDAGATWAALTGTATGLRTIDQHSDGSTGTLTAAASYDMRVRAVNAIGNGADSDAKAATSGANGVWSPTWVQFPADQNATISRGTELIGGASGVEQVTQAVTIRFAASDLSAVKVFLSNTLNTNQFWLSKTIIPGGVSWEMESTEDSLGFFCATNSTALSADTEYLILQNHDAAEEDGSIVVINIATGEIIYNSIKNIIENPGLDLTRGNWVIGGDTANGSAENIVGRMERVQVFAGVSEDVFDPIVQAYFYDDVTKALKDPAIARSAAALNVTPIIDISGVGLTDGTNDGSGGAFAKTGAGSIVTV